LDVAPAPGSDDSYSDREYVCEDDAYRKAAECNSRDEQRLADAALRERSLRCAGVSKLLAEADWDRQLA
jgi:hypothetical protein